MSTTAGRPAGPRTPNRRGEGDRLREELVEAASRLLAGLVEEEPLSLRAVARAVGVAPQSVYLHFADKTQLAWAVIERRFGELQRVLDAAQAGIEDPAARLRAQSLAYCRYGLEHTGHYRLLFLTRATGQLGVPMQSSPGAAVFDQLVAAIRACMDAGAAPRDDAVAVTQGLWAGLHGIVSLRLSKPGFPWLEVEALVDRMLQGLAGIR